MCTVQYINGFRLKLIRFWCIDLRDPHNSTTGELEKDLRRSWYLSFSWVNGGRYRLSPLIISRSEYSVVSGFFREQRWHFPKNSRLRVFLWEQLPFIPYATVVLGPQETELFRLSLKISETLALIILYFYLFLLFFLCGYSRSDCGVCGLADSQNDPSIDWKAWQTETKWDLVKQKEFLL